MDIRKVATELVKIMRIPANQQDTEIELRIDEFIPSIIYLDKNRFQQVFVNLLTNAIKFTHEGNIDISLRYKDSEKQLYVSV